MAHKENETENFLYLITFILDDWKPPSSFGVERSYSKDGLYEVVKYCIDEDCTYKTSHVFPSEITGMCPNAPIATHKEIMPLVDSDFWIDITPNPGPA